MPQIAHLFFRTAIVFLLIGLGIGLHMAIGGNHSVMGAHAHINLLGWVTMAIFGGYYALNPARAERWLARIHYGVYTFGVTVMTLSLYMLLLGNPAWEPLVAAGAIVVFLGVALFAVVLFTSERAVLRAPFVPG